MSDERNEENQGSSELIPEKMCETIHTGSDSKQDTLSEPAKDAQDNTEMDLSTTESQTQKEHDVLQEQQANKQAAQEQSTPEQAAQEQTSSEQDMSRQDIDSAGHAEQGEAEFQHSSQKRTRNLILVILVVVIMAAVFWIYWMMQPVSGKEMKTIEIPTGTSTTEIGDILQKNGLIRSELGFKIYLKFTRKANNLQPGTYHLRQGQSLYDYVQLLQAGDKSLGIVRFTIPEGFTLEQTANLLQKQGVVSAASFLHEADHGTFTSSLVQQIPKDTSLKHRLEGYLFPDTYEIYKGTNAHDIIEKMLTRTEQIITPKMLAEIKKRNLTVHQILTVASMIEREARVDQERPEIAGVIYNRLAKQPPMPLQIDATVEYVVGEKQYLTDQDLKMESPYNTYLHEGLPPGPIASPGIRSLQAAIYPAHNPYYFYVVKNNGTGEHFFAKTYNEQLQNEQKSEQNAEQQSHS